MPRPESTYMATVSDLRPEPGPGSEGGNVLPPQTFSELLRTAIKDSGLSYHEIVMEAGLSVNTVGRFVLYKGDMSLDSAEKILGAIGFQVVHRSKTSLDDPPQTFSDIMRAAIKDSGLISYELARMSGVRAEAISQFVDRQRDLRLDKIDKLIEALSLQLVLEPVARRPGPKPSVGELARPISDLLRATIKDSGLSKRSLGIRSGVDPFTIGRYLRGEKDILLKTAEMLFAPLGLQVVHRSKTALDDLPQTFSDLLREAIKDSGLTFYELARMSGVHEGLISRFQRREGDILLKTAEKLFVILPLHIVRRGIAPLPERNPRHHALDEVLSAIKDSPISSYALANRSGVSIATIIKIRKGYENLRPIIILKLANFFGIKLEPEELARIQGLSGASPLSLAGPISARRDAATIEDKSIDQAASISQAKAPASPKPRPTWPSGRCPVSFGADGSVIAGQPKKVTRRQLTVIRALLDAGPDGLTGEELEAESGRGGYRNILDTLAKDEDWRSRIRLAGGPHGRYRFALPGEK